MKILHNNNPVIVFTLYILWAIAGYNFCTLSSLNWILIVYAGIIYETWIEFSVHC